MIYATKIKSLFIYTLLLLSCTLLVYPQQQPNMPMPPAPGMPMGQMGAMPAPTEAELEEALKFIQYLEEHDPEQLKALEQLGQQMINQMSDEELNQISEMFNIAPDELREEAQKGLEDFAPAEEATAPTPEKQPVPRPHVSQVTQRQAGEIVNNLIDTITSLRQKASCIREVHQMIRSWRQELRDLMFYLKVIDQNKHHERLGLPQFKNLYRTLTTLYHELRTEEPRIILPGELGIEDTPYELLGIKPGASNKTIEKAFKELSDKYDPEKVEARLTAEGIIGKDRQRKIKTAKLAFEALEDAYEQLSDPKLRKHVDREIEAQIKQHKQDIDQANNALKTITTTLGRAIYDQELIFQLENFLEEYAPEQLKQKQTMEAEEKKRIEEQKKLGQIKPTQTHGTFEPHISFPGGNYGYYDDFAPYMYDDYYDYPDYSYGSPYSGNICPQTPAQPSQVEQPGTSKEKKPSNDKKNGFTQKVPGKREQAAQEIDKRSIETIIKDVSTNLDHFKAEYDKTDNKKLLLELDAYMHATPTTQQTKPVKSEKPKEPASQPEEVTGEDIQRLFGELPYETDETPKKPRPTAITIKRDLTAQLETFYKNSKLKELEEDTAKLRKKMRKLRKDPSEKEEKAWQKLEEKIQKLAADLTTTQSNLENSLLGTIMEEKRKLHGPIIGQMVSSLKSFLDEYTQTKNRFF